MGILADILGGIGSVGDAVFNYAKDNPLEATLILAAGYGAYTLAAPALMGTAATTPIAGAPLGVNAALPGLGGVPMSTALATAPPSYLPSTILAKEATKQAIQPTMLGALGKFAKTPQGAMLAGTALQVGGSYAVAKGAAQDAEELASRREEFSRGQFERGVENRRVGFTPYTRGILESARDRSPILASPSQALQMRRRGAL